MIRPVQQTLSAYLFAFPALVFLVVFVAYPLAWSLWLSLTDYNLIWSNTTAFVGLENYSRALLDPLFRTAMWKHPVVHRPARARVRGPGVAAGGDDSGPGQVRADVSDLAVHSGVDPRGHGRGHLHLDAVGALRTGEPGGVRGGRELPSR